MTASVSLSFCHDVDNSEHSYAAGLVPNTISVVQLLPPRFLEQLCKKLLGLWRGGHPAALSPVSLRACQLGDAVYVYCSLSAQIASCLDILCSYIGVVRSVWTSQSQYRLRNVTGVSRRSDYYRCRKALWSLSTLACGPRSRF